MKDEDQMNDEDDKGFPVLHHLILSTVPQLYK